MTSSSTRPVSADFVKLPSRVRLVARADGVTLARHVLSRGSVTLGSAPGNDLVVTHPTVSRRHLELSTEGEALYVKDLQSKNGTRLAGSRIKEAFVSVGQTLLVGVVELRLEDGDQPEAVAFGGLETVAPLMRDAVEALASLAGSDAPVLLEGEAGVGHEAAARALHLGGARAERPFEVIECRTATAATLFGSAGPGRARPGALTRADGRTVFFDGLEALPAELHEPLLRALTKGVARRSGDGKAFDVDARVIAGTTASPAGSDLFTFFARHRVRLPALRERLQDLPLLVRDILESLGPRARGFSLSPETMTKLEAHAWPGNVRELHDFVEKALALGEAPGPGATLDDEDEAGAAGPVGPATLDYKQAREQALTSFEREYVAHLLQTFEGNVSKAAREAGLDRAYLHRLIKRHGLDAK
jgi:DNA-binding NtrC family response regulator